MKRKSKRVRNRTFIYCSVFVFLLVTGALIAVNVSNTGFKKEYVLFVVGKKDNAESVLRKLREQKMLMSSFPGHIIIFIAKNILGKEIYPGKYKISRSMSTLQLFRQLYRGEEYVIKVVINKFRLWDDFISYLKNKVPLDSLVFSQHLMERANLDSASPAQLLGFVIPDTYYTFWTTSSEVIADKIYGNYQKFWNRDRRRKADSIGLSPKEVYILASIVEEETTIDSEKFIIASVYLNRLRIRMKLGACPTVKYALRDFELPRVLFRHVRFNSPYNTYKNYGLPPAPICTPSSTTIDAVLHAPKTDYLYFVVDAQNLQRNNFSKTYAEHLMKTSLYTQRMFGDTTKKE